MRADAPACALAQDFEALERGARYDDGYDAQSPPVRWFWAVAHSLPDNLKKKLLFFATGSDRAPIKGLAGVPFVISRRASLAARASRASLPCAPPDPPGAPCVCRCGTDAKGSLYQEWIGISE